MKRGIGLLALGLVACSFPFSYTLNLLERPEAAALVEGTFQVGTGGLSPNPREEVVQIGYAPDSRVSLSGAVLEFRVCFASQTQGAIFSGFLDYAAYLAGGQGELFSPGNLVAQGRGDVSQLNEGGQACIEGRAGLSPAQVGAMARGNFFVGARISGTAQGDRQATLRYRAEVYRLQLSGSVRP